MMRAARTLLGLSLALLAGSCNDGFGYIELKTVPASARNAALYIDDQRLDTPSDGVAVLRQPAGTRKLQSTPAGSTLCDIVVRKDRITTVTVSVLERPPRCQCARPKSGDPQGRRICLG
jgi:hypothetical protein